jgi:phosphorylase kinase alpha/beta subunit
MVELFNKIDDKFAPESTGAFAESWLDKKEVESGQSLPASEDLNSLELLAVKPVVEKRVQSNEKVLLNGKITKLTRFPGDSAEYAFQNEELSKMCQRFEGRYDLKEFNQLREKLVSKDTFKLGRYGSGGCSAVTVFDTRSAESAIDGELLNQWDRDNIMQALAERRAASNPELAGKIGIAPDAWKKGLESSLNHHLKYQNRFLDIILDRASGFDTGKRPNIRYKPTDLSERPDPWGHAQNDALSSISLLLFDGLNKGELKLDDEALKSTAEPYACLLHHYYNKVHVWEDFDFGAWEDKLAEHTSSIAIVKASLQEELEFIRKLSRPLSYDCNYTFNENGRDVTVNRKFQVTEQDVLELLGKCETKLKEVLPKEYIRSSDGSVRDADAALVNPLMMAALTGVDVVDDSMKEKIINNMEHDLMGHIGISRYKNDVWDGRVNRQDLEPGQEAQWSHVSPMLSVVYGEMFRRTGQTQYFDKQNFHFNRALAHVNERWGVPEAYIVDPKSRQWIPDANEPLAWAQAATFLAFDGMEQSLNNQKEHPRANNKILPEWQGLMSRLRHWLSPRIN